MILIYGICSHGMTDYATFVTMYKPHFESLGAIILEQQLSGQVDIAPFSISLSLQTPCC